MLDLALGRGTRMPETMTFVARLHDVTVVRVEFPLSHGRLNAEDFSAGSAAVATGDCSDFA